MTILGLQSDEVRSALSGVRVDAVTTDAAVAEGFARAAWSGIVEPGDSVAGACITALGAAASLQAVIDGADPISLATQVSQAGGLLSSDDVRNGLARWAPRLASRDVLESLRRAKRSGVRLIFPGDNGWPAGLNDLRDHRPVALWVLGSDRALRTLDMSVAIVGARAATDYGTAVAREAAAGLVDRGFAVVSGAAFGIDGMAHRSALASDGTTIAFLAGGVDRFYPAAHDEMLMRIAATGAVISELPCGAEPTRWRFLLRNRLIAAASNATVVVEAGRRSGSINTAGHASTLGRPLGAVPGPVDSPASEGCHRLLREYDAICVTNADEMAELVHGAAEPTLLDRLPPRDPMTGRVLDALSRRPRAVLDIARRCGFSLAEVEGALGLLELDGMVAEAPNGWRRA